MHGNVKITTIHGPDGVRHEVRFNAKTAFFTVHLPGKAIEGPDFKAVMADAEAWLSGGQGLDWKPLIAAKLVDYREKNHSIVLDFERYYRAERSDGEVYWKYFQAKGDNEDETKGKPGENSRGPDADAKILVYTPERWKALRSIGQFFEKLNERLKREFESDFEAFLDSLVGYGVESLIDLKRRKP